MAIRNRVETLEQKTLKHGFYTFFLKEGEDELFAKKKFCEERGINPDSSTVVALDTTLAKVL